MWSTETKNRNVYLHLPFNTGVPHYHSELYKCLQLLLNVYSCCKQPHFVHLFTIYIYQKPTEVLHYFKCVILNFSHQGVFSEVVGGKRRGLQEEGEQPKNKKSKQTGKDEDYYIPYRPKDFNSERG